MDMTPEGKLRSASKSDVSPDSGPSALDWVGRAGLTEQFLDKIETRTRRRRHRRQAIAGSLAAMLLLGFAWYSTPAPKSPASLPVVSNVTVILPERQVLPDGSIVELNEGARIAVAFTGAVRRVVLQGGEAHFQVTKNPQKPFVVEAGGVEVRAVGTAFLVQLGAKVEVLVTEGRVAVEVGAAKSPAACAPLVFIDAGSQGLISATGLTGIEAAPHVVTMSEAEIRERLRWRVPRLEFSQAPLAKIISLINQHSHLQLRLVLADPELGKIALSGTLRADNIDSLLQLLSSNYGIGAERGNDQVILRRSL